MSKFIPDDVWNMIKWKYCGLGPSSKYYLQGAAKLGLAETLKLEFVKQWTKKQLLLFNLRVKNELQEYKKWNAIFKCINLYKHILGNEERFIVTTKYKCRDLIRCSGGLIEELHSRPRAYSKIKIKLLEDTHSDCQEILEYFP